ncbi:MAG: protein-export membrane protein SecF [Elusimicrobia bacterium RIFOXYD2_FULL_34_15]|nr:MAG: protein-export membrane protein SecF [Elusimicrobia bacterium RIFOXYD2_FULL_34_15]
MQFFKKTNFDFVGKRKIFFGLSASLILISIFSIFFHKGLNYGIDFSGGTLIQLKFNQHIPLSDVRNILSKNGVTGELQDFPQQNSILVKVKGTEAGISENIQGIFKREVPQNPYVLERSEYVGPTIGKHLVNQAFFALFWSFVGIIVYVAFRFKSGIWGAAGVIAIIHDVFITVGLFSVLNREININVIAALLTLAGYSINDTIVIFDRMRENIRLYRKDTLYELINRSVNETLSRTVITSLTVLLVLLSLFFFGGEVIHDFALALLFGVIIGSYSTIFVATPIVYEWEKRKTQ